MIHNTASDPYPLGTVGIIGVCVALQAYVFLFNPPMNQFTLSALLVLYGHQYWRIVTAAFFHGGLMHILFNMTSLSSLGGSLERCTGTTLFLVTVLWQTLLCGGFNVAASWFLSMVVTDDLSYLKQQSVGFSGVIFALAVVDIHRSELPTRSVFGFLDVPAKWYPWVLLVALQVLIPNISFLGHLSGIVMGTIQAYGGLAPLLPSVDTVRSLEQAMLARAPASCAAASVVNHRFVPVRDGANAHRESLGDLARAACGLAASVLAQATALVGSLARAGARAASSASSASSSSDMSSEGRWDGGGGGGGGGGTAGSFVL